MEDQDKKAEISALGADTTSIQMKMSAVVLAGSIAGVVYSVKKGYGFWPGVGFFFLGGIIANIPMRIAYSSRLASNAAKIKVINDSLPTPAPQPSLFETLKNKISQN